MSVALMKHTLLDKKKLLLVTALMVITLLFSLSPMDYASAAPDPFAKVNENQTEALGGDELFEDANKAVYTVYIFGGLWVLGCLIVGTMLLGSAGSNPQRRTGGIVAIALAIVSGVILVNAYDMLGWMGS